MRSEFLSWRKRALLAIFLVVGAVAASFHFRLRLIEVQESQLRARLWVLNAALHEYTFDNQKAPPTVEELLQLRYLSEIPIDPATGSNSTWRIVRYRQNVYSLAPDGVSAAQSEVWSVAVKSGSTR